MDGSAGICCELLPAAKARGKEQGYLGARWPKCIGPGGREWPNIIHALLIFFAELAYWRFGPETAQKWSKRLGMKANPKWRNVLEHLSRIPQQRGLYVLDEGVKYMWTKWNFEHFALTGIFGILPGNGVDLAVMRTTVEKILASWNLNRPWGWDFPMLPMCAARLGEPERAVCLLFGNEAKFQFDARFGHGHTFRPPAGYCMRSR